MKKILFIMCACVLISCQHNYPEYPEIPNVEFLNAPITQTASDFVVNFSFNLCDGNGDIGLDESDTITPFIGEFQQNFYATAHVIENGKTTTLPYSFAYRIPRLRPEGNNKFIKAKIYIDFTLAKSLFPYDSVQFTYFVFDRSLNKSNVDTSAILSFQ